MLPGFALPRFAWRPVGGVVVAVAVVLAATATRYGYERDELYVRVLSSHPAWGYVDEPPLTAMLARAGTAVFGDNLWALRIPAMSCALAAIVLVALLARELGGGSGETSCTGWARRRSRRRWRSRSAATSRRGSTAVQMTTLDSGLRVSNEKQGRPVSVCSGRRESWKAIWPALRHYG